MFQVVFNLYPFSENLYLPSANIVQEDKNGALSHVMQKAIPATLATYSIALTPLLKRLFDQIEQLTPKVLEAKFKPAKAKTATPLAQLLQDPATKPAVDGYIHRLLDAFLSELAHNRLPITLDVERRTLAKDVMLVYSKDELVPHLFFQKTAEGVTYRLQLGTEQEKWSIQSQQVIPLTNTDPAWLLIGYALFRVSGINGNMVRPFRKKDAVHIPPDKVKTYFKQFIAKKASRTQIEADGFDVLLARELLQTRLEPSENILEKRWVLKVVFEYQGAVFAAGEKRDRITTVHFSEESEEISVHQVCRDQAAEADKLDFLEKKGLISDNQRFVVPDYADSGLESTLNWLSRHRRDLEKAGILPVSPQAEGRTLALLSSQIQVRTRTQGDWFDIEGAVQAGDFSFPFKNLVPNIRSNDPYYKLPDGTFFLIPSAWMTRYAELAKALQDNGDGLRLPKSLFTVVQEAGLAEGELAEALPLIDPDAIDFEPSADLKATLRPYQLRGVKWLIGHYRHGFGACLADDMGLGKTLQTIAVLLHAKAARAARQEKSDAEGAQLDMFQTYRAELQPLQALIILPASLVFNWQKELARFAPSLFVYAHTGSKRLKDARAMAGYDVVLTTYHTARLDLELLGKQAWHYIILDESQQIKNRESEVSKVILNLKADNKISLSGTPIENSLSDLWMQMEFINPDTLGSFRSFKAQFLIPIEKQNDEQARQRLFNRVRPFFMRRTKEEVAPELPALSDQLFYSEMAPEQQKQYEQLKSAVRNEILSLFDDPKTRIQALAALTRLRQLANHPLLADAEYSGESGKFSDVLALWETVRKSGHKVLFFSSFEKHLRLFRAVFEKNGHPFAWLTGDTPGEERAKAVQRFQEDHSVQAFFMTLKAGGVGLNLTAADYVFILDPWWNPAVEAQAIARAHRIGQQRPVTALRFLAKDTIEEKIRSLQERKLALGKELFRGGEEMPQLDRADLEMLLG
ncbi:MAG: DEAD/DEAH box helicase [Bacteroidetes bacterium]|nr:DEAD/DEAH box helicase [Bacteroidota bacterium]